MYKFKTGQTVFYSSFGTKQVATCKVLATGSYKSRGRIRPTVTIEVTSLEHWQDYSPKQYMQVGKTWERSTDFVYPSMSELKRGSQAYVKTQIAFIEQMGKRLLTA